MKRIFYIAFFLMLSVSISQAQFYPISINDFGEHGGRAVIDSCYVAGINSYTSQAFSLYSCLESSYDYAYVSTAGRDISIEYSVDTLDMAAGVEVADVTLILQGSFTGKDNWLTSATVFTTTSISDPTYAILVTTNAKYPYYRWKATGIGSNTYSRVFIGLDSYRQW